MVLNESKANMYGFIDKTWNPIKGKCSHDCSYCYMKRFGPGSQKPVRLVEKELKDDLGENNFIFVGSSTDMFADNINDFWIADVIDHCKKYPKNKYLFQTKNPKNFERFSEVFPKNCVLCITLESDKIHPNFMGETLFPSSRAFLLNKIENHKKMVTIEPIMDFDLEPFVQMIKTIKPFQVNIGADSQRSGLPEPSKEKVLALIEELSKFTKVFQKDNLARLLK